VRDLRLELLRDTPVAFLETLESAQVNSEDVWRMRSWTLSRTGLASRATPSPCMCTRTTTGRSLFYRRRGYELTGRTIPDNLDPTRNELEMRTVL
jgi:hypothetical protein